ncbi:MAG: GlsB/YeaQ/YmgE family stress response membrane protein [Propionibacteriaceae bacterium]|nr:GlsB/YeaQ/YmgE family stress response membrane protein [Propionibacteriaceae bacterium]
MLIIGLVLFGMLIGGAAQLLLGRSRRGIDWASAFVCGLAGSFVGGLLISLLAGDGLALRPSGIIGSLAGASILTAAWQWWVRRAARTS